MSTPNEKVIARLRELGFDVITRQEWGSVYGVEYASRRQHKSVDLPVRYAFQHITVTRNTSNFAADMRTLERIGYERFQSGISYNWAVDPDTGMIGEGMPLDAKGTHTVNVKNVSGYPENLNYYGHAIACIGMPGLQPSEKFELACVAILRASWDTDVMRDECEYLPHSMFAFKDCPTQPIRNRMAAIRQTAIDSGAIMPLEFWTPVPNAPRDPDGSVLKVGEALLRGNHAYFQGPIEGSVTDQRLDALEKAVKK